MLYHKKGYQECGQAIHLKFYSPISDNLLYLTLIMVQTDVFNIIRLKAQECGFSEIGISRAIETDQRYQVHFDKWLEDKNQAYMSFLERNKEKRFDPRKLHEGTKTIISLLYPYEKALQVENCKIASYAQGEDYHIRLRKKIKPLLDLIFELKPEHKPRFFVDSAPVADRYWALKSGLGFIGKNGFLIHLKNGSRFFIGHIFTALEFETYNEKSLERACGNCTKCIDACPTNAISLDSGLNANRCISYHTIESKDDIPEEIAKKNRGWIFGCDICQDVCPYNQKKYLTSDIHETWTKTPTGEEWLSMSEEEFNTRFKDTPLIRAGLEKIKRNVLTSLRTEIPK